MKVYFSPQATKQLANIYYYIAVLNNAPQNAENLIQELKEKIKDFLPQFPEIGQSVVKNKNIRRLIHKNYIITYSYNKKEQTILIEEIKSGYQNR